MNQDRHRQPWGEVKPNGRKQRNRRSAMHIGNRRFAQAVDQPLFDVLHYTCYAPMEGMFHGARRDLVNVAGGNEAFVQRQIYICQRDFLGRSCKPPAASVSFFRSQKTRFPQPTQDAADNDRIGPGMGCNIG